jgi:hypothetical protein
MHGALLMITSIPEIASTTNDRGEIVMLGRGDETAIPRLALHV